MTLDDDWIIRTTRGSTATVFGRDCTDSHVATVVMEPDRELFKATLERASHLKTTAQCVRARLAVGEVPERMGHGVMADIMFMATGVADHPFILTFKSCLHDDIRTPPIGFNGTQLHKQTSVQGSNSDIAFNGMSGEWFDDDGVGSSFSVTESELVFTTGSLDQIAALGINEHWGIRFQD